MTEAKVGSLLTKVVLLTSLVSLVAWGSGDLKPMNLEGKLAGADVTRENWQEFAAQLEEDLPPTTELANVQEYLDRLGIRHQHVKYELNYVEGTIPHIGGWLIKTSLLVRVWLADDDRVVRIEVKKLNTFL